MQKYLAIINNKTGVVVVTCLAIAWFCIEFDFGFNLNVTLFSIAVIFPLVFTIRQSFRRRDEVIKLLSVFKSSLNTVYLCFANLDKLDALKKEAVAERLQGISSLFFDALQGRKYEADMVRQKLADIFTIVQANKDSISNGTALKIFRFLKDVEESIENTIGIKTHGSPISLRAYCLVFIYVFPFVFIPTLVFDMQDGDSWVVYVLSVLHGFILISLYNVQDDMEDPFDQIGLDDIQLEEFHFQSHHGTLT
jgi:predicted membrane chloride channel (bestrophin family)